MEVHSNYAEPWKVTCVDTGDESMTGGRIKRVQKYVGNETFCLTYGDGVADINIKGELDFHIKNKNRATLAAVQPPGRWGHMDVTGNHINRFEEKTQGDGGWINGGFFVMQPEIFNYLTENDTNLELGLLQKLADENQFVAYRHEGFWQPMDTLRDRTLLEELWRSGRAPWKVWQSNEQQ